jgi:hypothetical protein
MLNPTGLAYVVYGTPNIVLQILLSLHTKKGQFHFVYSTPNIISQQQKNNQDLRKSQKLLQKLYCSTNFADYGLLTSIGL